MDSLLLTNSMMILCYLHGDPPVPVLVEHDEGGLDLVNLLLGQPLRHGHPHPHWGSPLQTSNWSMVLMCNGLNNH